MSQIIRFLCAVIILVGATTLAVDDADARRKFRFGGGSSRSSSSDYHAPTASPRSRSSTTIVPVPIYRGNGSHQATGSKPLDANGIELVYAMPDTVDYAYGSGYFDVGYRHMADKSGEYVIYAGSHFMELTPKLQAQIAERLGFDPVEDHKNMHNEYGGKSAAPATGGKVMALTSKGNTAQAEATSFSALSLVPILFFLGLLGIGIALLTKRKKESNEISVNRDSLEERMNARLQAMRGG